MIVGVFSDVHDQLRELRRLLVALESEEIKTALFLGDFCSPVPARIMSAFPGVIHCVFGNGDGDRYAIGEMAGDLGSALKIHGEYGDIELDATRIALTHYPFYAEALAHTGRYAAVFCGHSHRRFQETIGDCLLVNPGDLLNLHGDQGYALFDTETRKVDFRDLD